MHFGLNFRKRQCIRHPVSALKAFSKPLQRRRRPNGSNSKIIPSNSIHRPSGVRPSCTTPASCPEQKECSVSFTPSHAGRASQKEHMPGVCCTYIFASLNSLMPCTSHICHRKTERFWSSRQTPVLLPSSCPGMHATFSGSVSEWP